MALGYIVEVSIPYLNDCFLWGFPRYYCGNSSSFITSAERSKLSCDQGKKMYNIFVHKDIENITIFLHNKKY